MKAKLQAIWLKIKSWFTQFKMNKVTDAVDEIKSEVSSIKKEI